ncbi:hypothetical protein MTR_8g075070 [Medicago truncatula]|uniref:Uncharacterized protein n=1 Tax=Medicago truncatula TaxID=3880 RepID=G7LB57_MEDTR|nr:hypothetical protein MTR_8g075070 [Medicago truncatula]
MDVYDGIEFDWLLYMQSETSKGDGKQATHKIPTSPNVINLSLHGLTLIYVEEFIASDPVHGPVVNQPRCMSLKLA